MNSEPVHSRNDEMLSNAETHTSRMLDDEDLVSLFGVF